MKRRPSGRTTRRGLFLAATVTALLGIASPALATGAAQYCGASRGLTAEVAVAGAIDDARTSASGDGRFDCALAEQPQIFEVFDDPTFGHIFRASVVMNCE
ncbi:hypothetical protein [Streptomyces sp. NPDC048172]|uniref:hypothetical protein n=1 Tax=Streptomyces sp. NPDC048172 TaxID=3365505 RepID=UPI003717510D